MPRLPHPSSCGNREKGQNNRQFQKGMYRAEQEGNMTEEQLTLWIWLSLYCTPASLTFGKLIAAFDTPEEIHGATDEEIAACIGTRCRDYT